MINKIFPYKRFTFISNSILNSFNSETLQVIENKRTIIKLKKGQTLYHQKSIPSGVYIINQGKVKKYITGINNKEHIFKLAKEDNIIGHHSALNNETYSHSVGCLTDCVFSLISKDVFLDIVENNSLILKHLLKNFSHEFDVFINNSKILAQYNVRERTAISLLKLEQFFESNHFNLSRKDHSNILGTSVESLIRVLHDFKQSNIIEIENHNIFIKNPEKLMHATNLD